MINDNHARHEALDIHRSFIVQAPAGSGKTELLTQRYLNLIAHADKAPEEVIAITFTRKAAAEMRVRIMQALLFAQTPEPDKNDYKHKTWSLAKKVLQRDEILEWNILENPNRLRILTIDALSALICRQTPILTNFGGTFSVCENATSLYQLTAQRALTDAFQEKEWQGPLEQLLLHLDNRVEALESLFSDLLSHRDQWLPSVLYCYAQKHTLRESLENSLKRVVLEKLQLAARSMPESIRQLLTLVTRHAGNYFQENEASHPIAACAEFVWNTHPDLSQFESWFGLSKLLLTADLELRKMIDIRSGFAPKDPNKSLILGVLTELSSHPEFIANLRGIAQCPPTVYTESQWQTLSTLTQLLPLLAAQLHVIFQEKKQIDFTELNLSALKALGEDDAPTDLALYFDYQIHHLLIDEFQDTSITHLHLLEKITAGWQQSDGRTLFLVGDPMQSIYRFRNAEVGLFLRAQQQGIGDIYLEPLTLTMNFRSQATLVNWFNASFSSIFPLVSDIGTGRVPYTPAIAARNATPHDVLFYPTLSDEAQIIIDAITLVQTENPSDSIAILVRSRAQLSDIIPLLHKNNMAFQAIDIEPLFKQTVIQDLLSLTRALLHRADRIAWLAILRAPFCGLTLADLECIAKTAENNTIWEALLTIENSTELSSDGLKRIKHLYYFLSHAFETQSQHSLSQWIEGVWIALGGPACLSNTVELIHARAYFDLLIKLENDSDTFSIEKLNEHCQKLYANTESTQSNTIQIMTIHKSKGLEFDHVFLPGLHQGSANDAAKLLRWCDRPSIFGGDDLLLAPIKSATQKEDRIYEFLKITEKEKQAYEMTRVFYVAATRAKKSLHLSFELSKDEKTGAVKPPREGSFLALLWPLYKQEAPHNTLHTSTFAREEPRNALHTRQSCDWQSPIATINNTSNNTKPVKIDISLHDTKPQIIGTVIHEILQTITSNPAEINVNALPLLQWQARLSSQGILPHALPDALDIVKTAISNTLLDQRGQWILSKHNNARNEFAFSQLTENGIEHKIIDRSFMDENNTRWIIDYKTAKPKDDESITAFLEKQKSEYQEQLENYATLFASTENRPIQLGLYFPLCMQWIEWER